MFFDWLTIYQDHDHRLPIISDRFNVVIDTETGSSLGESQPTFQHPGSYSTSVNIRISGNRVTVSGNPSRVGRLDNLFGYTSLDQCVEVYNKILADYGIPPFTKSTQVWHRQGEDGKPVELVTDGATITEIHCTTNLTTGQYNADDMIKALSMLPYRYSVPRLHTNGKTCDWLTKKGNGSSLIYPSIYNKAHEIKLHSLNKLKRSHGTNSPEYRYLEQLIDYCEEHGVIRCEQKFKAAFLRRNKTNHYGMFNLDLIRNEHEQFLKLHEKLKVESMDLETITQKLMAEQGLTTRAANTTSLYAIQWMHGQVFDASKRSVQTHRCRLRKIGLDIALPCDLTKVSLVTVKAARTVTIGQLQIPQWYRKPEQIQLRAVA